MYNFTREIQENSDYEVIVFGGGPAGCAAATAAARNGAKTLLIESTYVLGGMGTAGLVPAWCPFSDKEKVIYRGIAEEVFTATKSQMPYIRPDATDWVPIDPEVLKRVYDELVTGSGAEVLFGTMLCDADVQDGRIKAAIVSNKMGLTAYKAKVFIDCTGDADLVAFAGGQFQTDGVGKFMASSLCFNISNVDMHAYNHDLKNGRYTTGGLHPSNQNSVIYKIAKDPRYPGICDQHLCNDPIGGDAIGFNAGHIWDVDNTNPVSVSSAIIKGRQIAHQFQTALAEYFPEAFGKAHLTTTAQLVGIRDSRRIVGEYTLTMADYIARASFPDEISRNSYYLDVHMSPEEIAALGGDVEKVNSPTRYSKGESHGIPYRALLPVGLNNVLVAGRSISSDRRTQGSVRVMPNCLTTGQAAGTAAALSARDDGNTHNVDTDALRTVLKEQGAYIN